MNPIKSLLRTFLNLNKHQKKLQNTHIENDMLSYSWNQRSFWAKWDLIGKSEYKLKFIMQSFIDGLSDRGIGAIITLASFVTLSYHCYNYKDEIYHKIQQIQEEPQKINENDQLPFLQKVVIKEVLLKQSINDQLSRVIQQTCEKPSVQHNLTKQINKLFVLSPLQKTTHQLVSKLLKEQVLYQRDIDEKLYRLLVGVIQSQRHELRSLFVSLIRMDALQDLSNEAFTNLLSQQGIKNAIADSVASTAHSYLDDEKNKQNLRRQLELTIKGK